MGAQVGVHIRYLYTTKGAALTTMAMILFLTLWCHALRLAEAHRQQVAPDAVLLQAQRTYNKVDARTQPGRDDDGDADNAYGDDNTRRGNKAAKWEAKIEKLTARLHAKT